jgi:hypothetical protein
MAVYPVWNCCLILAMTAISGTRDAVAVVDRPNVFTRNMMNGDDERRVAQAARSKPLPLPRDPEIAVREEFELARAQGTTAAYDLFIRRHGNHPLAAQARRERARLGSSVSVSICMWGTTHKG